MARFSIRDIFLLILSIGMSLATYRYFWMPPPDPNARPYLAGYLAILTMTTLGSFFVRTRWRRPCQGYALFAWLNLVFVMYGGFWLNDLNDAYRVVKGSQLGMSLGIVCSVLSGWLLEEARPPEEPKKPSS